MIFVLNINLNYKHKDRQTKLFVLNIDLFHLRTYRSNGKKLIYQAKDKCPRCDVIGGQIFLLVDPHYKSFMILIYDDNESTSAIYDCNDNDQYF